MCSLELYFGLMQFSFVFYVFFFLLLLNVILLHYREFKMVHKNIIFLVYIKAETSRYQTGFPRLLGSTNPCASVVHMEHFPSLAFKVLVWIFATTTKICTDGRSTWARAPSFAATAAPSYSSGPGTCPDSRVLYEENWNILNPHKI